MSIVSIAHAENYVGTLKVQVEGVDQPEQQSTVVVTKGVEVANLQINDFAILNYAKMNISLNCSWVNSQLGDPATVTITPTLIAGLLGKLQIKEIKGELNDNNCTLNLIIYSPNLRQNIAVTFTGTK